MTDATSRLAQWRLRLSEFDPNIVHQVRVTHQAADAHFRLHTTGTDESSLEDDIPVLTVMDTRYGNDETKRMRKLGFIYTQEQNESLIRQSRLDGAPQKDCTGHASSPFIISVTRYSPCRTPRRKRTIPHSAKKLFMAPYGQRYLNDDMQLSLMLSARD